MYFTYTRTRPYATSYYRSNVPRDNAQHCCFDYVLCDCAGGGGAATGRRPMLQLGVSPETVAAIGVSAFLLGVALMAGVWLIHTKIGTYGRLVLIGTLFCLHSLALLFLCEISDGSVPGFFGSARFDIFCSNGRFTLDIDLRCRPDSVCRQLKLCSI